MKLKKGQYLYPIPFDSHASKIINIVDSLVFLKKVNKSKTTENDFITYYYDDEGIVIAPLIIYEKKDIELMIKKKRLEIKESWQSHV